MILSTILAFSEIYNNSNNEKQNKWPMIDYIGKRFEQEVGKDYCGEPGEIASELTKKEQIISTGKGYGIAFPRANIKGLKKQQSV